MLPTVPFDKQSVATNYYGAPNSHKIVCKPTKLFGDQARSEQPRLNSRNSERIRSYGGGLDLPVIHSQNESLAYSSSSAGLRRAAPRPPVNINQLRNQNPPIYGEPAQRPLQQVQPQLQPANRYGFQNRSSAPPPTTQFNQNRTRQEALEYLQRMKSLNSSSQMTTQFEGGQASSPQRAMEALKLLNSMSSLGTQNQHTGSASFTNLAGGNMGANFGAPPSGNFTANFGGVPMVGGGSFGPSFPPSGGMNPQQPFGKPPLPNTVGRPPLPNSLPGVGTGQQLQPGAKPSLLPQLPKNADMKQQLNQFESILPLTDPMHPDSIHKANLAKLRKVAVQNQQMLTQIMQQYQEGKAFEEKQTEAALLKRLEGLQKEQDEMSEKYKEIMDQNFNHPLNKLKNRDKQRAKEKEQSEFSQLLTALNKNLGAISAAIAGAGGGGGQGGGNSYSHTAALFAKPLIPQYDAKGRRVPPAPVPLPDHLIPRALGGTGGDPDDDFGDLTAAQKRDQLSPFKKRKNKDQKKREIAKQTKDAQFLDGLFQDNLSEDTERQQAVREEEFANIQNQLAGDYQLQDEYLKNLEIPEFDPRENPAKLREELMKNQDAEEDEELKKQKEEAERKRLELKNKYERLAQKAEDSQFMKGSKKYRVVLFRVIARFQWLFKKIKKERLKKRQDQLEFYDKFLKIYLQVSKAWVRNSIRKPLVTIFQDTEQELNMNPSTFGLVLNSSQEQKTRLMMTRVRVKGILTEIEKNTNIDVMPIPLIVFLSNLCQPGSYVPNGFLTPYQLNRVDTDNYGAIIAMDEPQVKMVVGSFLLARVLITNILLKSKKQAGQDAAVVNEVVENNFLWVSSILYYFFMQVIEEQLKDYERDPNQKGGDVFSKKLLPLKEVQVFFKSQERGQADFVAQMKQSVKNWLQRLYLLITNSELIKKKQEGV